MQQIILMEKTTHQLQELNNIITGHKKPYQKWSHVYYFLTVSFYALYLLCPCLYIIALLALIDRVSSIYNYTLCKQIIDKYESISTEFKKTHTKNIFFHPGKHFLNFLRII